MLHLLDDLGRRGSELIRERFGHAAELPAILSVVSSSKDDLQSAAALQLSKLLGAPPRAVAEVLCEAFGSSPAVASTSVAGPGFVNIHLRDEWIIAQAPDALRVRQVGAGQTVVLDFSAPNVAKPMHIGHIRSTIIGDALARVFRAVGYTVIADNHVGDWGTQFGKLIVAYRRWLDPAAFEANPVAELLRLYVKFNHDEKVERGVKAAAAEPSTDDDEADVADQASPLLREARAELVRLQQGDLDNLALWKQFVVVSLKEFDRIYRRLGVRFDETLGESFYNDRLAPLVDMLVARGIAEESEGAIVVMFEKERDGEKYSPMLVRKADGGFLYGTTDIAALLYRVERWQPARILIVVDERQQLHCNQLFAVGRRLGVSAKTENVWFGLMRLPEGTISTRDGNLIGLEALLDEAERRATEVARSCNSEVSDTELKEIARVVGIGSVKYNDLSRDRQTLVTFSWDRALALQGNTAPYLQYAYARIQSVLRKAEAQGFSAGPLGPFAPIERALALKLLHYSAVVEEVAKTSRPHLLCEYLFDLAMSFSTFYNELSVLKAEEAERRSRLTLSTLVAAVLKEGLGLLGIEVLDRM